MTPRRRRQRVEIQQIRQRRGWCPVKGKRYVSASDAILNLLRIRNVRTREGAARVEQSVHQCRTCGGWHTSSSETGKGPIR